MNEFLPHISQSLDQVISSLAYFYPELVISVLFIAIIKCDLFLSKRAPQAVFYLTLAGLLAVTYFTFLQLGSASGMPVFAGMIWPDNTSIYFKLIFCIVAILFVLFIKDNRQLQQHSKGTGDLYAILVAALLGLNLMSMANNLLMVYLSIEMVSIASYIMVAYVSADNRQAEAAIKYVLFGAVCSAIMLYGISLLYAFTGTLNPDDPAFLAGLNSVPAMSSGVALAMVLIGIGFKLSFAPLHLWSPDVYEGAPTPVTAFLSTGPKVAGFAILIRFADIFKLQETGIFDFTELLGIAALATMIIGNFSAIWQNNVKRMLAYSSIGHTGFIMMAVLASSQGGMRSVLFYLFVYSLMNMAAFMLADHVEERTGARDLDQYRGLGKELPLASFLFVIVMISLTGLPPTAGFIGKLFIFSSALEVYSSSGSALILLLIATGAVTTLISLFYYIRVPLNAYFRPSAGNSLNAAQDLKSRVSLFIVAILILLGLFPQFLNEFIVV